MGAVQAAAPEVHGSLEGVGPAPEDNLSNDGAMGVDGDPLRQGRARDEKVADVRQGGAFLNGRGADKADDEARPRLRRLWPAPRVGLWFTREGRPLLSKKRPLRREWRLSRAPIGVGAPPHPSGGSDAPEP